MKRILISTAAVAFALTLAQPVPAQDLASQIVGVWKYTGVTSTEVASGKVNKPFGEKPNGQYVFTKGGRFVFSLVGDNRANPVGVAVTDAEALALYRTNSHGTGTYKVEGSHVTLSYDSSWNQTWTGTSQKRTLEIVGNKLTLASPTVKAPATGLDVVIRTFFEKVE